MAEVNIPDAARTAFIAQVAEYIEGYENHDARFWADSPQEAACDLERVARRYAAEVLAAELDRMADTPFEEGPWWALATSLRERAAELRGQS
jgi:hypothetical protein